MLFFTEIGKTIPKLRVQKTLNNQNNPEKNNKNGSSQFLILNYTTEPS
jgi:hypothetical protein